jgi:hypothetical protein
MSRRLAIALVALLASPGWAERGEPGVHFEIGFNTRQFSPPSDDMVALRTIGPADPENSGSAVTASFRFTRHLRWQTFVGFEAETGMLAASGSNVGGAYGVTGARGVLGPVTLLAELASGRRWTRHELHGPDLGRWVLEPRVRAELWMHPRFTLGGALGSTIGDHDVWMAGVYVGVHSLPFGRR